MKFMNHLWVKENISPNLYNYKLIVFVEHHQAIQSITEKKYQKICSVYGGPTILSSWKMFILWFGQNLEIYRYQKWWAWENVSPASNMASFWVSMLYKFWGCKWWVNDCTPGNDHISMFIALSSNPFRWGTLFFPRDWYVNMFNTGTKSVIK